MPATFSVIDINNDGKNELIAGGEWMPLTILAFENGQIVSSEGSWEAGKNGGKAGKAMLASPKAGDKYRQEYLFDEAEDQAEIIATDVTVTVPFGTFQHCLKIREWSELFPEVEYKYYAPTIGCIKEEREGSTDVLELISIQ